MPRRPRLKLAEVPFHVIQRANNRCACFLDDADRAFYLSLLHAATREHRVAVHAYVLMTNHVHFLMTGEVPDAISTSMGRINQCYAQHFNRRYRRIGTLWQGRFRSSLIEAESYLFTCHRYIECNPVRAGMVSSPQDYPWSSFHANALAKPDPIVTPHSLIASLGRDQDERRHEYQRLFATELDPGALETVRSFTNAGHALGSEGFAQEIETVLGKPARPARRGRPVVKK